MFVSVTLKNVSLQITLIENGKKLENWKMQGRESLKEI